MGFITIRTIRLQLFLLFLLFTFITLVVSIYCFSIYRERETSAELKSHIENTSSKILLLNKLQLQFIIYDSKNSNFYVTGKSIYISKHEELWNEINQELQVLKKTNTDPVLNHDLDKLSKELILYKNDFKSFITEIKLRGHRDYGLEGLMRDYIHKAETFKDSIDMVLLLTIRRNEKDYLLRKDPYYIEKLISNIGLLKTSISSNTILTENGKRELEQLINNYENCFNKWVEIDNAIGIDQKEGLTLKLKKHNEIFETLITKFLQYSNTVDTRLSHKNQIVFIAAILLSLCLCFLLSIFFSKRFTLPIVQLSNAITDIVNNNFSNNKTKLPQSNMNNETGNLITNFNWMIERIYLYIDEIKKNEHTINERDKKFKALIENSNDAIALTDLNGQILYASPSTIKIIGYQPDDIVGKSTIDLVHSEDLPNFKNQMSDVIRNHGKVVYVQFRILHKDGQWRWIDGYSTNLLNEPSVEAIITNYRDVTIRKNNELKIEEQYKELQKINSELDRFVYSASHDLKAPLTSILGMVSVARMEPEESSIVKYLDMAEVNVKKLLNIIKELTNFSRNARTEIVTEKINFRQIVNDLLESFNHLKNFNKINYSIDIDSSISFVSDRLRIKTLLSNLISNAIIYHNTAQANPYITITIKQISKGIVISIKDNGEGIDPMFQPKIFNMFYRASEQSEGSGLGLYIVKGIIEKLKGEISFKSVPKSGTEFTIVLPFFVTIVSHENQLNPTNYMVH